MTFLKANCTTFPTGYRSHLSAYVPTSCESAKLMVSVETIRAGQRKDKAGSQEPRCWDLPVINLIGKGRCHSRPLLALSCRPRSSERVASTTARTEQTRVPSLRASPSRVRLKLRLRADAPSADCPPPNSVGLGRAFRAARACAGSARCVGGIGGAWDPI